MPELSAFPIVAPTPETEWRALVAGAPEWPLPARPVLVVAPHPDDETLAVGGLLAELSRRSSSVHVLAVTDGEMSHPGHPGLAPRRIAEQTAALATLGLGAPAERLGLPDTEVARHVDTLADAIARRSGPATVVLAPWAHDGHADHEACALAARRAADRRGSTLVSYPVWAWQWATVDDLATAGLRRITLDAGARNDKARAVTCHRSQVTAFDGPEVVGPAALVRFARPWEVVLGVG